MSIYLTHCFFRSRTIGLVSLLVNINRSISSVLFNKMWFVVILIPLSQPRWNVILSSSVAVKEALVLYFLHNEFLFFPGPWIDIITLKIKIFELECIIGVCGIAGAISKAETNLSRWKTSLSHLWSLGVELKNFSEKKYYITWCQIHQIHLSHYISL